MEEPAVPSTPNDQYLAADRLGEALAQVHQDIEQERSALVRDLHDGLGGMLVGALMDLSWLAQQSSEQSASNSKLARAISLLRDAINLKRELIEELKPTLLEHIGLFAALRWHLKSQCNAAAVSYAESYPDEEVDLEPEVKIGVFRILEEALRHELSGGTLSMLTLEIEMIGSVLICRLEGDHLTSRDSSASVGNHPRVTDMQFRANAMGGLLALRQMAEGHRLDLRIPVINPSS